MSTDTHRTLGEHDAKIDILVDGQEKIFKRLDRIDEVLHIREGERRGVRMMFAGLSVVGGLIGAKVGALFK